MTNKWYDRLRTFTTISLPAGGALYFVLVELWEIQRLVGVNGFINTAIAMLGILLAYFRRRYNATTGAPDGDLIVVTDDAGDTYLGLGVNNSVEDIISKPEITLKVVEKHDTNSRMQAPHLTDPDRPQHEQ